MPGHLGTGATFKTFSLPVHVPRTLPKSPDSIPPSSERAGLFTLSILPTDTETGSSIPRTRLTGSTNWGPGALTGKVLKKLGENAARAAQNVVIRTHLSKMEQMQPRLLGSTASLTNDERSVMEDQCVKLVDLCIVGYYPPSLMTRAFNIVLRGFFFPGRQTWSHHLAEAIAKREIMDVFDLFRETFFVLLDDRSFRIKGIVDLETLSFRCPTVAHQVAIIISQLALKDRELARSVVQDPASSDSGSTTAIDSASGEMMPSFSAAIINAGFFRLVKNWVRHGLPHWDRRGLERLEEALNDVANAQEDRGDFGTAEEARDLVRKLQGRRFLLDDTEEQSPLHQPGLWLGVVEELPELDESEMAERTLILDSNNTP